MSYFDYVVNNHNAAAVVVITGAASGLGLSASKYFKSQSMNVLMADVNEELLKTSAEQVKAIGGAGDVTSMVVDVSDIKQVIALKDRAIESYGEIAVLMNNAASFSNAPCFSLTTPVADVRATWDHSLSVNFGGVLNGSAVFAPIMSQQENPSLIINTGSKQGITQPPGNSVYNSGKAIVKSYTEQLQHELRNMPDCKCSAHLFVPGWVHTGERSRTQEKPAGAWTPDQTIEYLVEKLKDDDFYIICPDNETNPALDKLRMEWSANDLIQNRPPLSRWHKDYKGKFDDFIRKATGNRSRSRGRQNGLLAPEE